MKICSIKITYIGTPWKSAESIIIWMRVSMKQKSTLVVRISWANAQIWKVRLCVWMVQSSSSGFFIKPFFKTIVHGKGKNAEANDEQKSELCSLEANKSPREIFLSSFHCWALKTNTNSFQVYVHCTPAHLSSIASFEVRGLLFLPIYLILIIWWHCLFMWFLKTQFSYCVLMKPLEFL